MFDSVAVINIYEYMTLFFSKLVVWRCCWGFEGTSL